MKTIHTDRQGGVATVTLDRGVTNALDLKRVEALAERLQALRRDPEVRGLVLSSANDKFFSIGFDIPQLYDLPQPGFKTFFQAFNRLCLDLYTFPKPTIAAITGHAIAGGCILALCCDYRFIAQGRKLMGLNEIKLGVPVPYPADCILRHLVGVRHARDMLDTGEFYQPEQLLAMGMVDRVLPLEDVLPESIEKARVLGAMPPAAFAMIKHNRVQTVQTQILSRLEEKEQFFIECWYSQTARQRLKQAIEKF
jgi:enoyl-CoA hydratase/carnithine racemase